MSYTFSDQQSKLSSLIGDPNTSSDDMWPLATRKKEINRGELQFALDAKNLREYATGAVSSMTISMPSDWLETYVLIVNNVVITNDNEISLKDWERYYNLGVDRAFYYFWEASGTRAITFFGSSSAINGQTYKLYYFKRPVTELSSDSDTSLHPEEYREASVYYAASELMKGIGKHQEADIFRAYYQNLVEKAKAEVLKTYVNKEYARPDFGDDVQSYTNDVQGRSWPF